MTESNKLQVNAGIANAKTFAKVGAQLEAGQALAAAVAYDVDHEAGYKAAHASALRVREAIKRNATDAEMDAIAADIASEDWPATLADNKACLLADIKARLWGMVSGFAMSVQTLAANKAGEGA